MLTSAALSYLSEVKRLTVKEHPQLSSFFRSGSGREERFDGWSAFRSLVLRCLPTPTRSTRTASGSSFPFLTTCYCCPCCSTRHRRASCCDGICCCWGISSNKLRYVELAFAALIVHESDLAEHGALPPALVVDAADAPHAAHIAVGITPIQLILVIQIYCC